MTHCINTLLSLLIIALAAWTPPSTWGAAPTGYRLIFRGNPWPVSPATEAGFILQGGHDDSDAALHWLLKSANGGDFVVLRASGGDDVTDYLLKLAIARRDLKAPNSVRTFVFRDRSASYDARLLSRLRGAEALYLAGGNQALYERFWAGTPVQQAINELIERGIPVAGISAGTAILGEFYFPAREGGISSETALANPYDSRITLERNLVSAPLLRGVITDTHFSERGRLGRLLVFLARLAIDSTRLGHHGGRVRGIGVDEETALLVSPSGLARVTGKGGVTFVELASPPEHCAPNQPLTARGYRITRLREGETFDLKTWRGPRLPESRDVIQGQVGDETNASR